MKITSLLASIRYKCVHYNSILLYLYNYHCIHVGNYTLRYPTEQRYRGRKLRTSPLHTRLEVQGACFGETNAYERPMWFTNSHGMPLSHLCFKTVL